MNVNAKMLSYIVEIRGAVSRQIMRCHQQKACKLKCMSTDSQTPPSLMFLCALPSTKFTLLSACLSCLIVFMPTFLHLLTPLSHYRMDPTQPTRALTLARTARVYRDGGEQDTIQADGLMG